MTALALNTATRFAAFFGAFIDSLDKAIAMAKAVHYDNPTATNIQNVRAIAATI